MEEIVPGRQVLLIKIKQLQSSITYDVVIIGGGLAGLTLAIQLADKNYSVVVLEKNRYPFHRVCGEYISMESWSFLQRVGLPLSEWKLPRITHLEVSSVNGNLLKHKLDIGGFGISRYKLDHELAMLAKAKGAVIMEDTPAMEIHRQGELFLVTTSHDAFTGKVLIGAFGKRSAIDKKLERSFTSAAMPTQNWIGVKYHIKSTLPPNIIQLHNFEEGYCGISRVEDDAYCFCYLTKAAQLKKYSGSITTMEDQLLSQNPFLKKIFSDRSLFLFEKPVTVSQLYFDDKLPVEKGVLMLGDAAGLIAPLCGNGMSMAFHASAFCFPLIVQFLSGMISRAQMEKQYADGWRRSFSFRLKAGRFLQPLLVKRILSVPAISILKKTPFVMERIVRATHGNSF